MIKLNTEEPSPVSFTFEEEQSQRLDKFLVACLPDLSRSRIQALIKQGNVQVDDELPHKAGQLIEKHAVVKVSLPAPKPSKLSAEQIPLDVIFENKDLIVLNKPAGMVVHPSAGHSSGTLVHAALAHAPEMEGVGGELRPGVVHRLDKDTSGLILLAKNDLAHRWLQEQFRQRQAQKTYLALVDGSPPTPTGRIEAPIGRDPRSRKKMAIVPPKRGRAATSEYRTMEKYPQHTLLEVHPITGRTHQIRTHLAYLGCPIAGDKIYGWRRPSLPLKRHFLHADAPGYPHTQRTGFPDIRSAAARRSDRNSGLPANNLIFTIVIAEFIMDIVDLRSDTVSIPTPAMREAMASAPVGDDVYGEDPTVNRLQELAAAMLGKEAALFIPSGTMGNLAGILAHCERGDEVILGKQSHTFLFEAGGISALGGVHSCQIPNQPDGTLASEDIQAAIRPNDEHQPITRLISLENTHNRCGGVPLSVGFTQSIGRLARDHNLQLHLDGARIFNAAVALGVDPQELAGPADSVTFCLSKGLCAPVGSLLCGQRTFIERAHRMRKQLGGGMRQVGILAAAGCVALESMVDRLAEDHIRASWLAQELRNIPGLEIDAGSPYTNMVFLNLSADTTLNAQQAAQELSARGVRVGVAGRRRFRLVTHYWIDDAALEKAITAFSGVFG